MSTDASNVLHALSPGERARLLRNASRSRSGLRLLKYLLRPSSRRYVTVAAVSLADVFFTEHDFRRALGEAVAQAVRERAHVVVLPANLAGVCAFLPQSPRQASCGPPEGIRGRLAALLWGIWPVEVWCQQRAISVIHRALSQAARKHGVTVVGGCGFVRRGKRLVSVLRVFDPDGSLAGEVREAARKPIDVDGLRLGVVGSGDLVGETCRELSLQGAELLCALEDQRVVPDFSLGSVAARQNASPVIQSGLFCQISAPGGRTLAQNDDPLLSRVIAVRVPLPVCPLPPRC